MRRDHSFPVKPYDIPTGVASNVRISNAKGLHMPSNTEVEAATIDRLRGALTKHVDDRGGDWDRQVESGDSAPGLWDSIPNIDSKEVARMRPIFESVGLPFDVNHIRPGGYMTVDELIDDFVPKLTGMPLPTGKASTANGDQDGH